MADSHPELNENELETLRWLVKGYSINEIANEKLFKSVAMVNKYVRQAKNKLNARSRDQLIATAVMMGLLS